MDDDRNFRHPADKTKAGEASMNIQPLEERFAELKKQPRKATTTSSSPGAPSVNPYEVRVSQITSGRSFNFPRGAIPNSFPSDTTEGQIDLNNLIDNIWDLRRQQERPFDPLLYMGHDIMSEILQYVVSLWGIAESRAWESKNIPRYHISNPLVLMNVSQQWYQFVISSPRLWSYLLIDTDDEDVLEYFQLFLHLSRNCPLFIVLHGRAVVSDGIVMDLLRVGNRIDGLVYESNISRSALAKFGVYLKEADFQLQQICPWYELEVQSVMQPQQHINSYSFPTSIHVLWMDRLFALPLPNLLTLSHFQRLSSLSVKIGLDSGLYLVHKPRLELPNLERLRLQMEVATDQQVDRPILIICRKLKVLSLRYALEYDLGKPLDKPATWMKFDMIDGLQELQIQLEIDVVNKLDPPADEWLLQYQWQRQQEREAQQERLARLERLELLELQAQLSLQERLKLERLELLELLELQERQLRLRKRGQQARLPRLAEPEQLEQQAKQLEQHRISMQNWLHQWLNLPYHLENVQHTSLEVTLPPQMHEGFIRDMVEVLLLMLPRLMDLTTSKFLRTFPEHLRRLCLHGFSRPNSLSLINLPNLISLEIKADGLDHLIIMRCIQMPQLLDLCVQVQDGPGELYGHDWRNTTSNLLNSISLTIKLPNHKQTDHVLAFFLPRTHSLNISSPDLPLSLSLAEPAPLPYTLCAKLGKVSAAWQENLITEWINPHHGMPDPANFRKLISLQRIVLDNGQCILQKESPIDELCDLLAKNIHMCPQLTSITVAQCPSSWPRFLHQLRMRNAEAMFTSTKCIETLSFYQPLHAIIIRWLTGAINAKVQNLVELPPIRQGKPWPMRPFPEGEILFGSCYICYITGMELGCLECETRNVDCGRERGDGSKVDAF